MTPRPGALTVTGLGRCGSSLVMQMLAAGGMPCLGDWPDYEAQSTAAAIAALGDAHAVKLLNPERVPAPRLALASGFIRLTRDPREQAKSHWKLLAAYGLAEPNRTHRRGYLASLQADERQVALALRETGRPLLTLSFERLVTRPSEAAADLSAFAGRLGWKVDVVRMPSVVRPRGLDPTHCLPGLLELEMLGEAHR